MCCAEKTIMCRRHFFHCMDMDFGIGRLPSSDGGTGHWKNARNFTGASLRHRGGNGGEPGSQRGAGDSDCKRRVSGETGKKAGCREDPDLVSQEVLSFLHSADHLIINVEGPLSELARDFLFFIDSLGYFLISLLI